MEPDDETLYQQLSQLLAPYGCKVIGFGPRAVGVMGDEREYGRSVTVEFPVHFLNENIQEVSTLITNRVRGVTRVLMNLEPHTLAK